MADSTAYTDYTMMFLYLPTRDYQYCPVATSTALRYRGLDKGELGRIANLISVAGMGREVVSSMATMVRSAYMGWLYQTHFVKYIQFYWAIPVRSSEQRVSSR